MSFLGFLLFIVLPQAVLMRINAFITKLESRRLELKKYYLPLLIALTIIGFFLMLDNNSDFGCRINNWYVFSIQNIGYSSLSLILLVLALIIKQEKLQKAFLLLESAYWLFKLFVIKGGYAVGVGGGPELLVAYFDTIVLFLRLLILYKLFQYKFSSYFLFAPLFTIMLFKLL